MTRDTEASLQAQLEAVTKRVVDRYTYEGLLFTALDVSNTVKQVLPQVRHRQVSEIVRQLFEEELLGENYTRSLIDVMAGGSRGTPTQAYLYHLKRVGPDEYTEDQRRQLAIPPVSVSEEDDVVLDDDVEEMELEVGQDLRARVPRKLLERAGITTARVRVDKDNNHPARLRLLCHLPGDPELGVATVSYAHPSQLHLPAMVLNGFDLTRPLVARVNKEEGFVSVEGNPSN